MSRRTGTMPDQERGSWFVNFAVKLFFSAALVLLFLSLIQCSVKNPESPSWDTQLTIPLIQRTYPMTELVDKIDGEYLSVDSTGAVFFEFTEQLDTVRLSAAEFQTPNLSQSISQALGEISIAAPVLIPVTTPVTDIGPLALVLPGNVPAMDFQVDADIPVSTSYSSMTVGQGTAWLIIQNNLGLDLSSVTVQLNDSGAAQLVGTFSFPGGIPVDARDSVAVNLAGRTLSNNLGINADCHTGGGTVLSATDKGITIEFRFSSNLTVTSATTTVPSLTRNVSDVFDLNESQVIQGAVISGGTLQLTIDNTTSLPATLTITVADLKLNNQPLVLQQSVPASGSVNQTLNLAGYELDLTDQTVPQQIPVQLALSSAGSGSNQITVNATDNFSVDLSLSNLSFASVTGAVNVSTTISPTVTNVDIPEGFENGSLAQAILQLSITNRFGIAGDYALQLNADNGKQLIFTGLIAAANGSTPVVSTSTDTNVADFLSPLPTSITITGTANFGDGVTFGTISSGDFVVGEARFTAPLALTLGATQVDFDIERVDTDGLDKASDDVQLAELVYTVNNHLPVGASLELYLCADSATLLSNPDVIIDGITIAAGQLSGGIVTGATSTGEQRLTLDRAEIDVLKNNPLFIAPVLVLPGSGGQVIRFAGSDYISLTARAELTYRFDGSF